MPRTPIHELQDALKSAIPKEPLTPEELEARKAAGQAFRTKRQALHLTVTDLARTLDVHPETVRNWERGKTTVPRTVELALRWIAHEQVMALTRLQE